MTCADIDRLASAIEGADSIVVGAGAGLSAAAGLSYAGERFERYFPDFAGKYRFHDMYSGGFYPYETLEEHWAYWSRYIWINRYAPVPDTAYDDLLKLIGDKDHFALTTNVDHCFQRSGFAKERLFYTQGDYGLFQCSSPCCAETFDNEEVARAMVLAQGFAVGRDGELLVPEEGAPVMAVPSDLVPHCPHCGRPLTMNLRADARFVEDAGWHEAQRRYSDFLRTRAQDGQKVLFLELGVGGNTPVIIKFPFWRMTSSNPHATYACVNLGEAYAPKVIESRSIILDADISGALRELAERQEAKTA